MNREMVDRLGCYPNLNVNDSCLKYSTTRGDGASDHWKEHHPGSWFIKAPNTSANEVEVEADVQHLLDYEGNRVDMEAISVANQRAQFHSYCNFF